MPLRTDKGVLKLITYVAVVKEDRILLTEYVTPPNPDKPGWWIPAPELEFGEDPLDVARGVLTDLGAKDASLFLLETESFQTPTAWHCMFHYRAVVADDVQPGDKFARCEWFSADTLPSADEFAHGGWERRLALRRLDANPN